MKKRALAALLWFYTGWYAGLMLADLSGVNPMLGPIIGVAAAILFAGDPRRRIWSVARSESTRTNQAPTTI